MYANSDSLAVKVKSITSEAEGVYSLDLRPMTGRALPSFTAGSHINLRLENGMVRSYSLTNSQAEQHRYEIAVRNDNNSRGGSRFVHESIRPGNILNISAPRNNFPLDESSSHTTLIAGGIGITPIWSMIQRLEQIQQPWELYYCARSRQTAAFLERLEALNKPTAIHFSFDEEGNFLDIGEVIKAGRTGTQLYCCGPSSMIAAFERATIGLPKNSVHIESFSSGEAPSTTGGFTVTLAKRHLTLAIPPGKTILEVLLNEGIDVPHSCREGVCGTCETEVLAGIPDHRDLLLSKEEKAANKTIMLCCSGAESDNLLLNL